MTLTIKIVASPDDSDRPDEDEAFRYIEALPLPGIEGINASVQIDESLSVDLGECLTQLVSIFVRARARTRRLKKPDSTEE